VIVLGAAAAGAWFLLRAKPPLTEEAEPNNDGSHANRIAVGDVTGFIGKRMSTQDGDRDVYIMKWPSGEKHVVTVKVSGIPNLDINLSENDEDGVHGATSDEGRVGEGEVLHRRSVDGPLVITVGETVPKGTLPVENVSDAYTLSVIDEKLVGETEPNNSDADANPLEPSHELRGYLDSRSDVDELRWMGADGTFNVIVRADSLPLAWSTGDNKLRTPGSAKVKLAHGDVIRLERTDKSSTGSLPARDTMWSVVVMP
jgi:hypothetical protein